MKKVWKHLVNNRGFYCFETGMIVGWLIGITKGFEDFSWFKGFKKK